MTRSDLDLPKPLAVMGIEGIYDIPGVIRRNTHPAYREFITSAFGSDESQWLDASPVHQKLHGWEGSVVLIHSDKDELVEQRQTDDMAEAMIKQGWTTLANYSDDTEDGATNKHREATLQGKKRLLQATIHCLHDEVWQRGTELAKAIRLTVAIST
jgi:kynurenine formamidase